MGDDEPPPTIKWLVCSLDTKDKKSVKISMNIKTV